MLELSKFLDAGLFKEAFERGQKVNVGLGNGLSPEEAIKAADDGKKTEPDLEKEEAAVDNSTEESAEKEEDKPEPADKPEQDA